MNGTIEIPFSGDKPSNGYLNYSNNTLTSGCLVFGDYAVTFDGNTTSTAKGTCSSNPGGSGSSTSGSQTPTWDKYYYADNSGQQVEATEFDDDWEVWMQENTDIKESCAKFSGGIGCVDSSQWNSADVTCNGDECTATGYIAAKQTEFISIGATCELDADGLSCYDDNGSAQCKIELSTTNRVTCSDGFCVFGPEGLEGCS